LIDQTIAGRKVLGQKEIGDLLHLLRLQEDRPENGLLGLEVVIRRRR